MSMCMAFWSTPDRAAGHSCELRDGHHGPHKCCCGRTRDAVGPAEIPELSEFYLTFFLLDADRPNPRFDLADPAGYVTICAGSATEAHALATSLFGRNYHDIYGPDNDFPTELYTRGELLRIVVPAGLVEQEDHR